MPNLNITGNETDFYWVYAAMAHPCNERHRNEFVAACVARGAIDRCIDIEIPNNVLSVILNAPSYEDIMERAYKSAGEVDPVSWTLESQS